MTWQKVLATFGHWFLFPMSPWMGWRFMQSWNSFCLFFSPVSWVRLAHSRQLISVTEMKESFWVVGQGDNQSSLHAVFDKGRTSSQARAESGLNFWFTFLSDPVNPCSPGEQLCKRKKKGACSELQLGCTHVWCGDLRKWPSTTFYSINAEKTLHLKATSKNK